MLHRNISRLDLNILIPVSTLKKLSLMSLGALQTGTVQLTGGSVRQMGYVSASTFDVLCSHLQPFVLGRIELETLVTEDLIMVSRDLGLLRLHHSLFSARSCTATFLALIFYKTSFLFLRGHPKC